MFKKFEYIDFFIFIKDCLILSESLLVNIYNTKF